MTLHMCAGVPCRRRRCARRPPAGYEITCAMAAAAMKAADPRAGARARAASAAWWLAAASPNAAAAAGAAGRGAIGQILGWGRTRSRAVEVSGTRTRDKRRVRSDGSLAAGQTRNDGLADDSDRKKESDRGESRPSLTGHGGRRRVRAMRPQAAPMAAARLPQCNRRHSIRDPCTPSQSRPTDGCGDGSWRPQRRR